MAPYLRSMPSTRYFEKAAAREQSPTDKALTEKALSKSQELSSQITDGIYRDMPKRMGNFMHPKPLL
jgi:hypothetical protein